MFSTKSWSDHSVPIVIHNVKKIQMKASVRHPNFKGRFYSHLFFYETHFFHLTASFQITNTKGLIMFNGGFDPKSFISIALVDASLQFCLSCGSNATCNKGYEVKTDDWYILRVVVRENEGQLRLNDGDALQLMCPSGEKYRPRNNVYISGAGMKDWNIIVDVTSNKTMFHGIIDTLKVNGLIVTYKMATLIDVNGMLNSLGYSLSDYVTEVYKNEKTITTLYCGVPERTAKSHYVRIVWFENMRRMIPAAGVEIIDVESDKQVVSKVNLYPEHAGEGIYACVLSQDGMLSVVHVFVVFRYKAYIDAIDAFPLSKTGKRVKRRIGEKEEVEEYEDIEVMNHNSPEKVTSNYKVVNPKEESESHAEWIGLIILLVLILLCFFPALCYCCTKDHPMWIKVRNFFNRIYSYITGQEYIEETEVLAEEDYDSEPAESESEGALGLDEDRSNDQLPSPDLQLKPDKMKPAKRSKSKGQKQSRPQSTQLKAQSETQMSQLGDEQEALPKKQMKKALKQPPPEDLPQTQSSNVIQQCPPGYHPQPCSPFYPIAGGQQYYYPSSNQLTMNQPTTLQRPSYGPQPTTLQRPLYGPQPTTLQRPLYGPQPTTLQRPSYGPQPSTLQRPSYGPQPSTLQRPSYGPLPLCGPSVSNIPPCRPTYNVLPLCRPPAFVPPGPSVSAYVPPQGPSQTSFTHYRQSPYSFSPKGPSPSALSPHGASSSAFSPYKPHHQYSSTQPSITKLHISSPSMSQSKLAPSRTGIHQSESRGRMFICRENNDDYQLQRRTQSQKVGRKFACRESHLDLENPNWQNDLSSYCKQQCDFVDQISVQIPPHRSFQAQSTYPETSCYQPHFPCRPSYNPYALYKPCNMNASIPPIDLVCNAYKATPFQTRRRESLSKDVNKNSRNWSNGIVEDQLNFSDNNSLNFHRSSVLASSTIYLQCDTGNLLW
ncbi:hemicentin-1 [Biomphalaria glabrata]|nr:SCO-spondin-like [Biomphalaria glabrata]